MTLAIAASAAIAQTSSGTAFAVAPEVLVTNRHVVAGCSSIEVISAQGRQNATLVVAGTDTDLAVLRVTGVKGSTARLRTPRAVRLGEPVLVFGFPLAGALSSEGNFTSGLVSALRGLRDAAGEIQITAPVQPGNSGGPLMDASGLVIGVVQAKLDALRAAGATGDIPQNVNFAISLNVLADFLLKNKVAFHDAAPSSPLETAQVAAEAQGFTHRVECRGASRQTGAPPDINHGQLTFADGASYVGEFKDGKIHGQGTATYSNGDKYVGEFRDNKRHGQGTYTFADGGKYVGEYREDNRYGQGAATYPNGDRYAGEFRINMRHGLGSYTFADGSRYSGEYRGDKRNGQGTQFRADGSVVRSGIWEDDVFVKGQ